MCHVLTNPFICWREDDANLICIAHPIIINNIIRITSTTTIIIIIKPMTIILSHSNTHDSLISILPAQLPAAHFFELVRRNSYNRFAFIDKLIWYILCIRQLLLLFPLLVRWGDDKDDKCACFYPQHGLHLDREWEQRALPVPALKERSITMALGSNLIASSLHTIYHSTSMDNHHRQLKYVFRVTI